MSRSTNKKLDDLERRLPNQPDPRLLRLNSLPGVFITEAIALISENAYSQLSDDDKDYIRRIHPRFWMMDPDEL